MPRAARSLLTALLALLSGLAAPQDSPAECLQVVHPAGSHVLAPDEYAGLELLLQVNCEGVQPARMLQLFSATGNGTAGAMQWQMQLDATTGDMLEVSWQMLAHDASDLEAYEHWHCSGWRQWQLLVHREDGASERALVRVRAPLLEHALETVEQAALERRDGTLPSLVQVGAMDGVGHDHLHPFIAKGTWQGLLVEPLRDFFEKLVSHYARSSPKLQFANMCVDEVAGTRIMRRLARGSMDDALVAALGYDGSSSLLSDAQGLPPGIALSFDSLSENQKAEVLAGLRDEVVQCAPLQDILAQHGFCSASLPPVHDAALQSARWCSETDVFAVDTEGYDLKIVQQLLSSNQDSVGLRLPLVIFMEVGLLSAADQAHAAQLLQAHGYTARRCGYGMEMLAVRTVY